MISAVIVTYRTGEVLWQALDAARAQCDQVVVVDNGNPAEVSARLRDDPGFLYLSMKGNRGFSFAANRGAEAATGTHLLILNPDAILQPGCVDALRRALNGAASPAIAGARLIDVQGREQRGSRRRPLTPRTLLAGLNRHREPLPHGPSRVGAISGAGFLVSKTDWRALGGFDESYFLHVEDLDLCRRARELGGDVLFVPDTRLLHRTSSSDAPDWVVETHKAMGLKHYLICHHPRAGRLLWPAMSRALARRRRRSR